MRLSQRKQEMTHFTGRQVCRHHAIQSARAPGRRLIALKEAQRKTVEAANEILINITSKMRPQLCAPGRACGGLDGQPPQPPPAATRTCPSHQQIPPFHLPGSGPSKTSTSPSPEFRARRPFRHQALRAILDPCAPMNAASHVFCIAGLITKRSQ